MKKIFLSFGILATISAGSQKKDYPIQAVSFTEVKFSDKFWLPRLEANHRATIPASFERCENTGRVRNFEMAAAGKGKLATTFPFDDTDIYKTIEGASYSLSLFPDKKLEAYIDTLINKIAAAQEEDGYLYTARTMNPADPQPWAGKERWEKEREMSHELYNAGHLYEAAVAHYYATGKRNLLNIALKNADLVCSVFGPGKKHVAPGHQIIEMGLVKLYRLTGKKEYLETANDFIYERGHHNGYDTKSRDPWRNGAYWQDHIPVTGQDEAIGHSVRACYLYSGVADVAALTQDQKLLSAIDRIWENMVTKKFYVQGGIGAVPGGERFGDNYELPNKTAYNETCAAIANVYWNHRMFLLHGDAKYFDILERSLYNGLLSGVSLDGRSFFYSNAMEVKKSFTHHSLEPQRSGWFECSCCPTNMVRLMPSIPGYVYAKTDTSVYVNLFVNSASSFSLGKTKLNLAQENNYPWDGNLKFLVSPEKKTRFALMLRLPGWARNEVLPSDLYRFFSNETKPIEIRVNGEAVAYRMEKGYALIHRQWNRGDVVEMTLPMEVKEIMAHEKLEEARGKVAIQRGPLVYCAEGIDNNGRASNFLVPENSSFQPQYHPAFLNGVTVLQAELPVVDVSSDGRSVSTTKRTVTAIPYYSWANRGRSEMLIWFTRQIRNIEVCSFSV
jgi:hypothetical protein